MERSRHGSTAGQVRKAIRADIQTGVFPAGSRLTSEMLAERYRVSRTPVREAGGGRAGLRHPECGLRTAPAHHRGTLRNL